MTAHMRRAFTVGTLRNSGRFRHRARRDTFPAVSAYTVVRATQVPDYTGGAAGAFFGYGRALEAEQLALNVRVLPPHTAHVAPGGDPTRGHSHRTIEEIYFVLAGEIIVKLGDDVVALEARDAVRIRPETPRAARNDSDDEAVLLMLSARVDDHESESQAHEGFWPSPG
jgi:mannose-6-phosphate isomerase-like protein (cupin superfamily)